MKAIIFNILLIGFSTQMFAQVSLKGIVIGEKYEGPTEIRGASVGGIPGVITVSLTSERRVDAIFFDGGISCGEDEFMKWLENISNHYNIKMEKIFHPGGMFARFECHSDNLLYIITVFPGDNDTVIPDFSIYDKHLMELEKEKNHQEIKDDF